MKRTVFLPAILFWLPLVGLVLAEQPMPAYLSKPAVSKSSIPKKRGRKRPKKAPPKSSRPAELVGSKEQRVAQNLRAIELGLFQIRTEEELGRLAKNGTLVELVKTRYYFPDRLYVRKRGKKIMREVKPIFVYPWVKMYLDRLARDYYRKFSKRFSVPSGARSLWFQHEMTRRGSPYYTPYAAVAKTPLGESLHVRGIVIDISRLGMKPAEVRWMRERLIADKKNGVEFKLENQEEIGQEEMGQEKPAGVGKFFVEPEPIDEGICFHIVVFPKRGAH